MLFRNRRSTPSCPLEIDPAPTQIERVFVRRMELVTSTTVAEVRKALARDDRATLLKYGRFVLPIADRILADSTSAERTRIRSAVEWAYARVMTVPAGCR